MADYTADAAQAQADIAAAGAAVTFARGAGAFTPSTGRVSGAATTATSAAVRVIGTDRLRFIQQSTKLVNPIVLLVGSEALGTFEPTPGDTMTFSGDRYVVRDVNPIAPDGTDILYSIVGSA